MSLSRIAGVLRDPGRRERLVVWGVAAAALAPFAALLVADDKVLPYFEWSDYTALQLPVHEFVRQELRAARAPLWIPWIANGTPLHASQQAAIFYPGVTLPLLAFPASYALKFALFAHLALAYAGQYLLCRAVGRNAAAASLGALILVQSGFMVNHLMAGHVTITNGAALVPWLFWALLRLFGTPNGLRAAVAALIGGGFALGSHPQVSYYALLTSALCTARWLLYPGGKAKLRTIGWLVIAAVVATLLGAVQVVPSAELALNGQSASPRGGEAYAATFALDGLDVARLVAPNIAGNPFLALPSFESEDFFHERVVYVGLGTLALAACGLTRANVPRWQFGAAVAVLVSLAIALGKSTPWFSLLGGMTPGLFWFRCPGRVFAVATPLVALLAGSGCDAILNGEPRARGKRLSRAVVVLACGAGVIVPALVSYGDRFSWRGVFEHGWATARSEALATVVLGGLTVGAIVLVRRVRRDSPRFALIILALLLLGDLGYNNAANFWLEAPEQADIPREVLAVDPPIRFVDAPYYPNVSERWLRYSRMVLTAVRNQRSMVGADDGGVLPGAVTRFWRAVEREPARALAVGACSYVTHRGGAWRRLRQTLPRVRFATGRAAALCGLLIEEMSDEDVQAIRNQVAGYRTAVSAEHHAERDDYGDARVSIAADGPRHIEVHVEAPADGVLVVADSWYPGWICEVDGVTATIRSAHGVFRAVNLPAGPHHVVFEYQPKSFFIGAAGSIAGLVLTALLAIYDVLMSKRLAGIATQ